MSDQLLLCATKALPFVKWAGGKRRLLPSILQAVPKSYDRYLEPFTGGGAVALSLNAPVMLLNDANAELMETYRAVRDDLPSLLTLLDAHKQYHSESYFYEVRKLQPEKLSPLERAARFIYLNKTCFNGLYRVNKGGAFNVPYGRHAEPTLYDAANLRAVSQILERAELYTGDYQTFLSEHIQPGDFVYLDPPYVPVGRYSDFKRYTKEQFCQQDQVALAQTFSDLVKLGAYPVLSNSYSDLTLELYAAHNIQIVEAARNINQNGNGRGQVREILVTPKR